MTDADRAARSARSLALATLAAALVGAFLLHLGHGPDFGADDHGQYLSHARALLEGRPYGDIGFIYTTYNHLIGPPAEPPGLPVLVAPFLAMSGDDLLAVRFALAGMLGLLVWLVWRYYEPLAGARTAWIGAFITLAALTSLHVTDTVLSDLPFAASIWGIAVAADTRQPLTRSRLIAMALLGALAFTFRLAALALLPTALLLLILRPRGERPGLLAVGVVWVIAALLVMRLLPTTDALGAEAARDLPVLLADIRSNIRAIKEGVLLGFLYPLPWNVANDVWHLIAGLVALAGAADSLRRAPRRFTHLFAVAYVAMLVVLPTNSARYLWPLYPLQAVVLVHGARLLWTAAWRQLPAARVQMAGIIAVAVMGVAAVGRWRSPARDTLMANPEVQQVVASLRRAGGPATVRVAFFSPRSLTWHTRIPAMGPFIAAPDDVVMELRRLRITHVVTGSFGEVERASGALTQAVATRPDAFESVENLGTLHLYRVRPG